MQNLTIAEPQNPTSLTAVIASGSEIVRNGLATLLRKYFRSGIGYEVDSWGAAQARIARDPTVNLCLINLDLLQGDSQRAIHGLRASYPALKIVVVGQSRQRVTILATVGAGAHGYIHETMPMSEIADALRSVMAGHIYLPDLVGDLSPTARDDLLSGKGGVLTERQEQVLQLLARGASNKEIARDLQLAEGTVKVHLGGLFKALGVHSRTAAVASVHARSLM